jgi:hypothetical protein
MAPYDAGSSRLAVPELALVQRNDGTIGFAGRAIASGTLPGGRADALQVPLSGNWSPSAGLTMWTDCAALRFDRMFLHARRLRFVHPASGEALELEAPLPAECKALLRALAPAQT